MKKKLTFDQDNLKKNEKELEKVNLMAIDDEPSSYGELSKSCEESDEEKNK